MQQSNYNKTLIFISDLLGCSQECPLGIIRGAALLSTYSQADTREQNARLLSEVIFSLVIAMVLLRSLKLSLPSPPSL